MRKINIHEAKTTLSRLVEAVEAGEEIVLARAGRPVAMITRLPVRHGIRIGTAKGLVRSIAKDFDRPLSKKQREVLFGGPVEP
ncbi:MAG: type II toxin-antitoxin system prevent-host-death family antitoxin [Proteobacteria bacterium]|nr:type II toxin-antitoxin system prevent-host-death family antitoxin [Pseudomonadota bacterium]